MSKKFLSSLFFCFIIMSNLESFSQATDQKISKAAASWTAKMNEWLKLSPEKTAQLTKLNEQMLVSIQDAYKPVKSNPSATDDEKKAAANKLRDAMRKRDKELNQLLSSDEQAVLKAHQNESRAIAQTKIMSNQLDLSPEQESKIEAINLEASKKLPANTGRRNGSEISNSEKKQRGQEMRKVQQEKEKAYAEVLTAEQMKKYTETRDKARKQMKSRKRSGNQ